MASSADPADREPLAAALRNDLIEVDYTVDGVADFLGPMAAEALLRDQTLLTRRRCAESAGVPVSLLVRLFGLGEAVDTGDLDRALPSLGVDGLARLGLISAVADAQGAVRALCDLRPYADEEHAWWVASDHGEMIAHAPLPINHVLGVGSASLTLASWTPRPRVQRALDLGTGCGIQALHLSTHCQEVVVTDVSARALDFAGLTAAVSGLSWDVRQGSLLEPVAGERFDLIVSNPPFVITPRRAGVALYEYRDAGRTGDALTWELISGLHDHLNPGGVAQMLVNWEVAAGEEWRDRWRARLDGCGLDAWVIRRDVTDPARYAETWVRDGGTLPGTPEYDALYAAWLDDFAERGVEEIHFGIVTLARPADDREPWVELDTAEEQVSSPMGPAILAGMRARTWLATHDDGELLATAWQVAPDVTEERTFVPGASDPSAILLRQGGGLRRTVLVGTVADALVGVCDGDLTSGQALAAIAVLLDRPVEQVVAEALPVVRALIADGFLHRA